MIAPIPAKKLDDLIRKHAERLGVIPLVARSQGLVCAVSEDRDAFEAWFCPVFGERAVRPVVQAVFEAAALLGAYTEEQIEALVVTRMLDAKAALIEQLRTVLARMEAE